jgi:hypothetical protein
VEVAGLVDEDRFARLHVAHEFEADAFDGHRLRRDHPFGAVFGFELADAQRADAERIAERDRP